MWYPTHATAYYVGVTHLPFVDVSCQGTPDFDPSKRVPNADGNTFTSEVGLFRTAEGGLSRMIICGSQGEYLEAGRIRGEYAGFNQTFVGDATACYPKTHPACKSNCCSGFAPRIRQNLI
jgi:hypothetical protein